MSDVNLFAGMGSHQSAKAESVVWLTPPAIIEALGGADSFDLDPCSLPDRPWPTARAHYTEEDNGLMKPWHGRVWLNPPYSTEAIARFFRRMVAHGQGTALIFARTETESFHEHVWQRAHGVLFLRGRLNFHYADGRRAAANGGAPSVLIAYGQEDLDILAAAPIDGHLVPLRFARSILGEALTGTWRAELDAWFAEREDPVSLADLYRAFQNHPKAKANQHWRGKLRQVLQRGQFERVERGLWQRRGNIYLPPETG